MDKKNQESLHQVETPLSKFSPATLRDRRSVRTTFRLSKETREAMAWLAKYYRVKPKEVIDLCVNLLQAIDISDHTRTSEDADQDIKASLLEFLGFRAATSKKDSMSTGEYVRRTQVISRKSLGTLNDLSESSKKTRDKLVEDAILTLKLINQGEEQKNHEQALEEIQNLVSQIEATEQKLEDLLAEGDPILHRLHVVRSMTESLEMDIEAEIYKREPIDPNY